MTQIKKKEQNLPSKAPSEISKIEKAIFEETKIRNLESDEPIKQALRYVFALIGLRPEQIPEDVEKAVLINFIKGNLKNFAPSEIKFAFEAALRGDFKTETNHFGKFSALYLTNIFKDYIDYRNKIAAELTRKKNQELQENQEPTEEQKKLISQQFDEKVVGPKYFIFLENGKIDFEETPAKLIFIALRDRYGMKDFIERKKPEIKKEALKRVETWFEINLSKFTSSPEQTKLRKLLNDPVKKLQEKTNAFDKFCFEIAVEKIFQEFKNDKIARL